MSTTAPDQVNPTSLDLTGLSVATASAGVRSGTVYDPAVFASAVPVWFHPMPGGANHLMVCARARKLTPEGGVIETTIPSWYVIHGPSGARKPVPGWTAAIPANTVATDLRLMAAASRAPDYLYLLYTATLGGEPAALLQLMRVAPTGVSIYVEELVPKITIGVVPVIFDKGLRYATPFLHLYGTTPDGTIFQIRKRWAEVGTTARQASGYTPSWEYFTGDGFSSESELREIHGSAWADHLAPLAGVSTAGPLSFAAFRHIVLMSTCEISGTDHLARVWESRQGRPFRATPTSVTLGPSASWLGHGLMLQPQLEANPAKLAAASVSAGVPYLVTTHTVVDTGPPEDHKDELTNTWGLHTIRL